MADTLTSKGFTILDPLLNYDVNKFNANMVLLNSLLGTIICTSTTRPSTNLWDGMTLWETDTQRVVIRAGGAWRAIPMTVVVADQAARDAITTKYNGQAVWRIDRSWVEYWDGAAWRVQGLAKGATIADLTAAVTSPMSDQLGIAQDINMLCRWTGSAWVGFAPLGGTTAAHRRDAQYAASGVQSIPSHALTTLQFGTARYTSTDVTASGTGNQDFTLNRTGLWRATASTRCPGGGAAEVSLEVHNITDGIPIAMQNGFGAVANLVAGDEFRISATGKVIRAQLYQSTGVAQNTSAAQTKISLTWLRP